MTKMNSFVYQIWEALTVPKQKLVYNSKSLSKAQKLPAYSDQSVDRFADTYLYRIHWRNHYFGTISCYLAIFKLIHTAGRQLIRNVWWFFSGIKLWQNCRQNFLGTSMVVEKVGLLLNFLFLAQTTIRMCLHFLVIDPMLTRSSHCFEFHQLYFLSVTFKSGFCLCSEWPNSNCTLLVKAQIFKVTISVKDVGPVT